MMKISKNKAKSRRKKTVLRGFAFAPLEEVEKALKILNVENKKSVRNTCKRVKRSQLDIVHLNSLHYCRLIKHAILKHEWKHVMKLLLAYIDEPKSDKFTSGAIFKYTLLYIFNDPVAQSLNILNEFLQVALSCQTEEEKLEFVQLLVTLKNNNIKEEENKPLFS